MRVLVMVKATRNSEAGVMAGGELQVSPIDAYTLIGGVPNNPGAWLMATAKNRAIDQLRRRRMLDRTHESIQSDAATGTSTDGPEIETDIDEDVDDELLRLVLIACHPVLSKEASGTHAASSWRTHDG
jgi:predicted RNA polymerase sigma factor